MWVLGIEPKSPGKAAGALNFCTLFLAPGVETVFLGGQAFGELTRKIRLA